MTDTDSIEYWAGCALTGIIARESFHYEEDEAARYAWDLAEAMYREQMRRQAERAKQVDFV